MVPGATKRWNNHQYKGINRVLKNSVTLHGPVLSLQLNFRIPEEFSKHHKQVKNVRNSIHSTHVLYKRRNVEYKTEYHSHSYWIVTAEREKNSFDCCNIESVVEPCVIIKNQIIPSTSEWLFQRKGISRDRQILRGLRHWNGRKMEQLMQTQYWEIGGLSFSRSVNINHKEKKGARISAEFLIDLDNSIQKMQSCFTSYSVGW